MTDQSRLRAKRAIADVVARLQPWRQELAMVEAKLNRPCSPDELLELNRQCARIALAVTEARQDVVTRLAGADAKVKAHSHVTDIDKALDNLEAILKRCQAS